MLKQSLSFFAIISVFLFFTPLSQGVTDRYALVIGNSDYIMSPLRNPVHDAQDMAAVLQESGFTVNLLLNGSQRQMETSIRDLGKLLRNGGVGLFYYAGHGVQVDGVNYLIPVDAEIETEAEVKYEAVDASRVMSQMQEAGNEVNLVFLDACRNNPYARSFSRSAPRGLAQMDSPVGSLVAFATAPGAVAADGKERNGVYTKYLIKAIRESGLEIGMLMRHVRAAVRAETQGNQIPFELSSLEGEFYFKRATTDSLTAKQWQANTPRRKKGTISILGSTLTLNILPEDAEPVNVKFLNYEKHYEPGMNIPAGKYRIEISSDNFNSSTVTITVPQGTDHLENIKLESIYSKAERQAIKLFKAM